MTLLRTTGVALYLIARLTTQVDATRVQASAAARAGAGMARMGALR